MNTQLASFHAYVYGRVQGVFFRAYIASNARQLGLVGYARNLSNGSVEVMAEGEVEQLEKLIGLIKTGPSSARVDDYKIEWSEKSDKYLEFHVF